MVRIIGCTLLGFVLGMALTVFTGGLLQPVFGFYSFLASGVIFGLIGAGIGSLVSTKEKEALLLPPLTPAPTLLRQSFSYYLAHKKILLGIVAIPFLFSVVDLFLTTDYVSTKIAGLAGLFFTILIVVGSFIARWFSSMALFRAVTWKDGEQTGGVGAAYKGGLSLFFPTI